jgi:hypothetical protein
MTADRNLARILLASIVIAAALASVIDPLDEKGMNAELEPVFASLES